MCLGGGPNRGPMCWGEEPTGDPCAGVRNEPTADPCAGGEGKSQQGTHVLGGRREPTGDPCSGERKEPTGSMLSEGCDEDSVTNVLDRTVKLWINFSWFFFW